MLKGLTEVHLPHPNTMRRRSIVDCTTYYYYSGSEKPVQTKGQKKKKLKPKTIAYWDKVILEFKWPEQLKICHVEKNQIVSIGCYS